MNSITEKIKTLDDAYEYLGLVRSEELPFAEPKNDRQVAANAFVDGTVLVEALNEGVKPNYNTMAPKYEIWWDLSGSGFSFVDVTYVFSDSFVSARLVFHERETARYAAQRFPEVFRPLMTFPDNQ